MIVLLRLQTLLHLTAIHTCTGEITSPFTVVETITFSLLVQTHTLQFFLTVVLWLVWFLILTVGRVLLVEAQLLLPHPQQEVREAREEEQIQRRPQHLNL